MHSVLPQSVCYLEVTDLAIKTNCDNLASVPGWLKDGYGLLKIVSGLQITVFQVQVLQNCCLDGTVLCCTWSCLPNRNPVFGGRRLDAGPLYINELDTINSLLDHKKHVRGSSDIGLVAFIFA